MRVLFCGRQSASLGWRLIVVIIKLGIYFHSSSIQEDLGRRGGLKPLNLHLLLKKQEPLLRDHIDGGGRGR